MIIQHLSKVQRRKMKILRGKEKWKPTNILTGMF
jgi:hypothetical protein